MFVTLKIVHFLALLLGGASAIAPGLMRRAHARSGDKAAPLPPAIAIASRVLLILGLVGIVLLWLTGGAMMSMSHDWGTMPMVFWVKLIAATVIFGVSIYMNLRLTRAANGGTPPSPALVARTTTIVRLSLLVAVVCAVIAFN